MYDTTLLIFNVVALVGFIIIGRRARLSSDGLLYPALAGLAFGALIGSIFMLLASLIAGD